MRYVALNMLRGGLALGGFVLVTAVASVTRAAPGDSAGSQRAQVLFDEAIALSDAGQRAAACVKFRESLAAEESVGTLLNVGDCETAEGNSLEAARAFRRARELNVATVDSERRRVVDDQAGRALSALAPMLGELVVRVTPTQVTPTIVLASRPTEKVAPGAVTEVLAGPQSVVVSAPGYVTATRELTVRGQSRAEVEILLLEASPGIPAERGGVSGSLIGGLVLGIAGVGGLVAGGVTFAMAAGRSEDIEAHCGPAVAPPSCPDGDPARANDLAQEGKTFATASTIAFAVGGAALATGLTLVVVDVTSSGPQKVSVGAVASPAFVGLSAGGSF